MRASLVAQWWRICLPMQEKWVRSLLWEDSTRRRATKRNISTATEPALWSFCYCSVISRVQLFATPWTAARQASLSITNSRSPPKLMSTESVMPSNHLSLCHPLLLPSIFPSIRFFSNESALHIRWPRYWSSSFSINPSNEYSGLSSFRMDWFDLLAFQGALKSLLQHHSLKAWILQHSAFFIVQLPHPYMTTGKTIAWTVRTFVGKLMSLLFNTLFALAPGSCSYWSPHALELMLHNKSSYRNETPVHQN